MTNTQEDLTCPRCGKTLSWSCPGETGTAFCEAYSSQLLYPAGSPVPPCEYRGQVRRLSNDVVVLDETRGCK